MFRRDHFLGCFANGTRVESTTLKSGSTVLPGKKRYAIIGAGFAGLATCWNLIKHRSTSMPPHEMFEVHVYDAFGVGWSASSAASGLLHPLNTRGNIAWKGLDALNETLALLKEVEEYSSSSFSSPSSSSRSDLYKQTGILRFAKDDKQLNRYRRIRDQWLKELQMQVYDFDDKKDQSNEKKEESKADDNSISGYMFTPQGFLVNSPTYLSRLKEACCVLAQEVSLKLEERYNCQSNNTKVEVIEQTVESLEDMKEGGYSEIIICAGAAYSTIKEVKERFPLKLSETYAIEMSNTSVSRNEETRTLEEIVGDKSLLGRLYLARPDKDTLVLGAVHSETSPTPEAALKCAHYRISGEEVGHHEHKDRMLSMAKVALEKGEAEYPRVIGKGDYRVSSVHSGVRALPPKTPNSGRLPLLGKVDLQQRKEDDMESNSSSSCWMFLGLGARGLLYHAYLAKALTKAIAANDENLLPPEVLRWKQSTSQED